MYIVDRFWYSVFDDTWHSYECPIETYYHDKKSADYVCEVLNDTKILGDNEKYEVVEVEE